jgi:hypothetical protein
MTKRRIRPHIDTTVRHVPRRRAGNHGGALEDTPAPGWGQEHAESHQKAAQGEGTMSRITKYLVASIGGGVSTSLGAF